MEQPFISQNDGYKLGNDVQSEFLVIICNQLIHSGREGRGIYICMVTSIPIRSYSVYL